MWLKKAADFLHKGLSPLVVVVGKLGSGVIAVMMLVTVADITGRRVFNQPILGAFELSEFMLVIVVFFSLAHCELLRGHVTIDLLVSRLRQRAQDAVDSIMYFFFLVAFGLLTWQLFLYTAEEWQFGHVSGTLGVPISPFILVSALGSALLSLVVLMHLLLFLAGARSK